MFITNSRISKLDPLTKKRTKGLILPETLEINNNSIEIVKSFELLGIVIDTKLTFNHYGKKLKRCVYTRLYSIKRLFYLPFKVKIQFFKNFILPLFDYCSSLFIYFSQDTLQSIYNLYYTCLYLLFKFDLRNLDNIQLEKFLNTYSLDSLLFRYFKRLFTFSHKIFINKLPVELYNEFEISTSSDYNLRKNKFKLFKTKINNKSGKKTFKYIVGNLINNYCFKLFLFSSYESFETFLLNELSNIMNLIFINYSVYDLNNIKLNNYITYKENEKLKN